LAGVIVLAPKPRERLEFLKLILNFKQLGGKSRELDLFKNSKFENLELLFFFENS
jgi:hypothetical protein